MKGTSARWLKVWIRFGFLIKGFVYILLGVLAAQAALTYRQQAQDAQGVLRVINRSATLRQNPIDRRCCWSSRIFFLAVDRSITRPRITN